MGDDFYVLRQGEASVTVHTVKGDKASGRATAGFVMGSPQLSLSGGGAPWAWRLLWGESPLGLSTLAASTYHFWINMDHGLATSWCYSVAVGYYIVPAWSFK